MIQAGWSQADLCTISDTCMAANHGALGSLCSNKHHPSQAPGTKRSKACGPMVHTLSDMAKIYFTLNSQIKDKVRCQKRIWGESVRNGGLSETLGDEFSLQFGKFKLHFFLFLFLR